MKLEEIKKLIEAATPGPWEAKDRMVMDAQRDRVATCDGGYASSGGYNQSVDAAFIAAARTLMPKLLNAVEVLGTLAAQSSRDPISTSRADCMAALAQAALDNLEGD